MNCQMMVFETGPRSGMDAMARTERENLGDFRKLLTDKQEMVDGDSGSNEGKIPEGKDSKTGMTEIDMTDSVKSKIDDTEMVKPESGKAEIKLPDLKKFGMKTLDVENPYTIRRESNEADSLECKEIISVNHYQVNTMKFYVKNDITELAANEEESVPADIERVDRVMRNHDEEIYNIFASPLSMDIKERLNVDKKVEGEFFGKRQEVQGIIDQHVERSRTLNDSTVKIMTSRMKPAAKGEDQALKMTGMTVDFSGEQVPEDRTMTSGTSGQAAEVDVKTTEGLPGEKEGSVEVQMPVRTVEAEAVDKGVKASGHGKIELHEVGMLAQARELEESAELDFIKLETEVETEKYFPGNKNLIDQAGDLTRKNERHIFDFNNMNLEAKKISGKDKNTELEAVPITRETVERDTNAEISVRMLKTQDVLAGIESLSKSSRKFNGLPGKNSEVKDLKVETASEFADTSIFDLNSNSMNMAASGHEMETALELDLISGEKQELPKTSLISQMSESIETGMDGEKSFISIKLKPHLFGQMSIDLVRSSEGISARISADKDVVKHLLKDSSGEIAALFEEKNLKVENIVIETRESTEGQGYSERNRQGFSGNLAGGFNEGSRHGYNQESNGNQGRNSWISSNVSHEETQQRTIQESTERTDYGQGINIVV